MIPYETSKTALLVVDPYNDFLHPKGLTWPFVRPMMRSGEIIDRMAQLIRSAGQRGVVVAYAPHHRYQPGSKHYCGKFAAVARNGA